MGKQLPWCAARFEIHRNAVRRMQVKLRAHKLTDRPVLKHNKQEINEARRRSLNGFPSNLHGSLIRERKTLICRGNREAEEVELE